MFTLRFDMRAPDGASSTSDLYAAAVDMCAWAETRGAVVAVLSEHHDTDDGHLAAPHLLASAIAARTSQLAILLAAAPIPLWDPVRLAEEICALDIISRGRVMYAFGVGHRPQEYQHFGVDFDRRGRLADENLSVLIALLRGEEVDYRGRTARAPRTSTRPGPNSGPTSCTTRLRRPPTDTLTIRWPASPAPAPSMRCVNPAAPTGYSRRPKLPNTSPTVRRCRSCRCVAASRRTWRGAISNVPS